MAVERHLVGAGGVGDGLDPHGPDSMPIKQISGNRENPLTRRNSLVFFVGYGGFDGQKSAPLDMGVTGQYL